MTEKNQTIVIKKIKKGGHAHHGGAWKLAYADFVTAMMAFFLLLWLLGAVNDKQKLKGIAEYFKDPWKPVLSGGDGAGDATSIIKGGGDDLTRKEGQVKMTEQGKQAELIEASDQESEAILAEDARHLQQLEKKLEQMIETNPVLQQFQNQLKIDITSEGLRIQIVDQEKRPMFSTASARMEPYAAQIIDQLAPAINELPNRISIAGHTDARPFPGSNQGYTNWELSADRSNAARKELVRGGLKDEKILRVIGLASSVAMDQTHPLDPVNRRISIIVMNKRSEDAIVSGAKLEVSSDKPLNKGTLQPQTSAAWHPPIAAAVSGGR